MSLAGGVLETLEASSHRGCGTNTSCACSEMGLAPLVQLGQTLSARSEEIVAMWRFTRNNGINERFHNKMELINRQAYGFRNFQNYRLRVKVLCS